MSTERSVLFIGLPGSGKSTYLGALAGSTEHPSYQGKLHFAGYPEERAQLEVLIDDWLQCKTVERTKGHEPQHNVLHLKDAETGEVILLNVPDLSGEIYDRHCERRTCSSQYFEMASNCDAVIVFCHSNKNYRNEPIPIPEGEIDENDINSLEERWTPGKMSLQSKLVDILQMLLDLKTSPKKLKVSVVISAWDLVGVPISNLNGLSPIDFLQANLSLLFQFLQGNSELLDANFFGVSAQGGDYENIEIRKALLRQNPAERVFTMQGTTRLPDLSLPVKWLIDDDQ